MKKNEDLEKAAKKYHKRHQYKGDTLVQEDRDKDAFFAGAKWQAKTMYTEDHLAYFAGYCAGKRMINPEMSISEILEEWKEKSILRKK